MTDFQIGILKLVKSALTGESVSVPEDFDWEEALTTAKKHQIIPVIYYGAKYSSLTPPEDIMRILELATFKSVAFSQNQLYALDCYTRRSMKTESIICRLRAHASSLFIRSPSLD